MPTSPLKEGNTSLDLNADRGRRLSPGLLEVRGPVKEPNVGVRGRHARLPSEAMRHEEVG